MVNIQIVLNTIIMAKKISMMIIVTKALIPTGRGSYVVLGKKTLVEILASFDRAHPEHTVMMREEVIRAHNNATEFAGK